MQHKRLTKPVVLVASLLALTGSAPSAVGAPSEPGATTLVSTSLTGSTAAGSYSQPAEGGLAFVSTASNLDHGDTNRVADVFFSDGFTRFRVPRWQLNGPSSEPSVGHAIVVFSSKATDTGADTNGVQDVFLYWDEGTYLDRVSVSSTGAQANGASGHPSVAGGSFQFDPVYVAFQSSATNLVAGDTNRLSDIFVRYYNVAGGTKRVSLTNDGRQAETGASTEPVISGSARYVAFTSQASDLVPDDTNGTPDIFVRDLTAGTTTRVSVSNSGRQSTGSSSHPSISGDGRYVVFVSTDGHLSGGTSANASDVYIRDLVAGTTRRVSVSSKGKPANGASWEPTVSGDGALVAFTSAADNLVPADTNARTDVFVRDLTTGPTTRASVSSTGAQSRSNSHSPSLGYDPNINSTTVAFVSDANGGLVAGDTSQSLLKRAPQAPPNPFGDFDSDGLSDVVARSATGQLNLYRGSGNGLAPPVRIGASGWNAMDTITRLGDFDLDGYEDVIAREHATGKLWLYPGRRTHLAARILIGASGWNGMREITAVGDLNSDSNPDLVAVQTSTGDLYMYPGRGTGLGPRVLIGHGGWSSMDELTGIGDLNGDGHIDLVARQPSTAELWLYPGTAAGTSLSRRERIGLGWNGMRDLVGVGDFDRNGGLDLVAVQKNTSQLWVYQLAQFRNERPAGTGFTTSIRPVL